MFFHQNLQTQLLKVNNSKDDDLIKFDNFDCHFDFEAGFKIFI